MRKSNFELVKIIAMLAIVTHHLVAKNAFNIDTEIIGVTPDKLAVQVLGNLAFIGNNLFFLVSAHFLCRKEPTLRYSVSSCLRMEKSVLFYGVVLGTATFVMGGGRSGSSLSRSCPC